MSSVTLPGMEVKSGSNSTTVASESGLIRLVLEEGRVG